MASEELASAMRKFETAVRVNENLQGSKDSIALELSRISVEETRAAIEAIQDGEVGRLREALKPFAAAASLFTSAVHYGGIENVREFPTAEEWRRLQGLFPEFGGAVRKSPAELRAALKEQE